MRIFLDLLISIAVLSVGIGMVYLGIWFGHNNHRAMPLLLVGILIAMLGIVPLFAAFFMLYDVIKRK